MKPQIRTLILAAGVIAPLVVGPLWGQNSSNPRIIRLSFVEGNVTIEPPDLQTWAQAPVNTPLEEGFKLSTGDGSFAEVQFENGGTVRLGQFGLLEFTALGLAPDGTKIDHLNLREGYATFHPLPSRIGESLDIDTPCARLTAQGGAQFRVDLDQGVERVEVFDGEVSVRSNQGETTLARESLLLMRPGTSEPFAVSQGISQDDWDRWVEDREIQLAAGSGGPPPDGSMADDSESVYGMTDLSQYGNWVDVPGEGYGWIPFGMGVGWAPYVNGQWCWYPGWGYIWIGSEPWGWWPYHNGGWRHVPGPGWVWFPSPRRKWSANTVAWFHGPGWVGWVPRSPRRGDVVACDRNCGGGVVSASAFRNGGVLTGNFLAGVNPTTGERIKDPGIAPTPAAKLPGLAVSLPASRSRGTAARPSTVLNAGPAAPSGSQNSQAPRHHSAIVYDPQQGTYVNSFRVTPQREPAPPTGSSTSTTPGAKFGSFQPAPAPPPVTRDQPAETRGAAQPGAIGSSFSPQAPTAPKSSAPIRSFQPASAPPSEPRTRPPEARGDAQPGASGSTYVRQGPAAPKSEPPATRAIESRGGEAHVNSSAPAGGHSSPAPSGGGHSSSPPATGGHH